jgi:NADPH:quinone reductase-like Zn-dependent oxidoreductase
MKAIVVTDRAAGTAGMKLVERPGPQAAINDVVVRVHASGFVSTEMAWPSKGRAHRFLNFVHGRKPCRGRSCTSLG